MRNHRYTVCNASELVSGGCLETNISFIFFLPFTGDAPKIQRYFDFRKVEYQLFFVFFRLAGRGNSEARHRPNLTYPTGGP